MGQNISSVYRNHELAFINREDVIERLVTRRISSVPHWLHFWMTGSKQFVLFVFHSVVAVCETHMTKQGCWGAAERLPNFICLLCEWQKTSPPTQLYLWASYRNTSIWTHKQCHSLK